MVYPALLQLMRTPRLPVVHWTDAPADLNGLVRFAERLNLVSARVPSHFSWPLQHLWTWCQWRSWVYWHVRANNDSGHPWKKLQTLKKPQLRNEFTSIYFNTLEFIEHRKFLVFFFCKIFILPPLGLSCPRYGSTTRPATPSPLPPSIMLLFK